MISPVSSSLQRLRWLLACSFLLWAPAALAQSMVSWDLLANVEVSYEQDLDHNTWWMEARFNEELRALEGKAIRVRGYLIPATVSGNLVVLSAFPMASCFFCGGAGPESMMEVIPGAKLRFSTDDFVELEGILQLTERSEGSLYQLTRARIVH